jgi:hypothetical protein
MIGKDIIMAYFKIQYSSQVGSNVNTSDLYSGIAQSEAQLDKKYTG